MPPILLPIRRRLFSFILGFLCLFAIIFYLIWPPLFFPQSVKFSTNQNNIKSDQSISISPSLRPIFGHSIWNELNQLNCSRILLPDDEYVNKAKHHRIVQRDPAKLPMDCPSIHSRWKFPSKAATNEEAEFPIAFARTVFKDFIFLEQMLSIEYASQNIYCYSIDAKANKKFKSRIHELAKCFSNIFVAKEEFNVFSNGKNVSRSHLACLKELDKFGNKWKYAILLQNHDIPLRTNAEMVGILQTYNGTNAISTGKIMPISVNHSLDWSIRSLHLYQNASQIPDGINQLRHTKSLNLIALSRAAVRFSLHQLDLDPFIDQLEKSKYGMDEVLFSTLNSNLPDFPGGFSADCLFNKNRTVQNMGRYTIWRNYGTQMGRCISDHFRHDLCIYGIEDLVHISQASLHFYLNKMLPSFDYGAIFCWFSILANRVSQPMNINQQFYRQLPHVRYNQLRIHGQLDNFEC